MARKRLSENGESKNTTQYATWNVRGIAHKEELGSVLNEKQIKIAAITESKKKFKCIMETHKYVVIHRGVNRGTRAQVGVMFGFINETKTQLLTTHTGAKE